MQCLQPMFGTLGISMLLALGMSVASYNATASNGCVDENGLCVPQDCDIFVGDFIWRDLDGDGVQDPGEPGCEAATVWLNNGADCLTLDVDSDVTDGFGEYGFRIATVDETCVPLTDVDVSIRVDLTGSTCEGLDGSPKDATTDDLDSDCDPATGVTDCRQDLTADDLDIDCGYEGSLPIDIEKLVRVEPPGHEGDVCDVFGKPVELTFPYAPGTAVITAQDDASATGTPDDDGESFIVATDRSKVADVLNGEGEVYFSDTVLFDEVFTASASNAGEERFKSNTFIYVFEDSAAFGAGSNPLQTMRYHTSCSQPIQLGDVIGSVTLVGYVGEDGAVQAPDLGPSLGDADADTPTGPAAEPGDTVVFTYVVTNPIPGTQLADVVVTDQVLAPVEGPEFNPDPVLDDDGFNAGDTNQNNKLEFGEVWLYTSTVEITDATMPVQYTDKATVVGTPVDEFGIPSGSDAMDMDPANYRVIGLLCRSSGFWATRGGNERGGFNYTQAAIDAAGGCLNVCGVDICESGDTAVVDIGQLGNVLEALCTKSNDQYQQNQLFRQMTAAALNCATSGDPSCSFLDGAVGESPGLKGITWADCTAKCIDGVEDPIALCTQQIACFNKGGYWDEILGDCVPLGACVDAFGVVTPNACFDEDDCVGDFGPYECIDNCHVESFCNVPTADYFDIANDFLDCMISPENLGQASSSKLCRTAKRNSCTIADETGCDPSMCLGDPACEP